MKKIHWLNFWLFWMNIALIIFAFSSCSTVNRHKSSTSLSQSAKVHVDSSTSSSHTKDTGGVKKDYSVVTQSRTDSSVTEQVIEFDSSTIHGNLGFKLSKLKPQTFYWTDTSISDHTANDYVGDTTFKIGDWTIGDMVYVPPIKRIITRTTTVIHQSGTTQNNKSDSNYLHIKDTVATAAHRDSSGVTKATTFNKDVKRISWGWLWLLLLIPAGRVAYNIYKKRPLIS